VVADATPYFGHPEMDLMLVDYFQPVPGAVFDAYSEIVPIDAGFAQRRDLWCIYVDLACITVQGAPFDRYALDRLSRTVRHYR
jgi:fructosamine-3-kinase